jgi:hypothetical protein
MPRRLLLEGVYEDLEAAKSEDGAFLFQSRDASSGLESRGAASEEQ